MNTELQRWKRGDPDERGWYVVRFHSVGEWVYETDYWHGKRWGFETARRVSVEHLPLKLETLLETER